MGIDNMNIKGLPENMLDVPIDLAPEEKPMEDTLSRWIVEMILQDDGTIAWDIFPVSYQGLLGYSVVIGENKKTGKGLLMPFPADEVIKFFGRFIKSAQEMTSPFLDSHY